MLIMATITANLHNYNADLLRHTTKIVSDILQGLLEKYYSDLLTKKKCLVAMEDRSDAVRDVAGGKQNEIKSWGISI